MSDCTPESIFSSRVEHQVDLDRKLQEDPLMAIRKQELDTRKKILDNPIRMKQIKEYIEKTKEKRKKHKKKKKKKRRGDESSGSSSSSSNSDSEDEQDLDKLLLQKLDKFNPKEMKASSSTRGRGSESPRPHSSRRERSRSNSKERTRRRRSRSGEDRRERRGSPHPRPSSDRRRVHQERRSPDRRREREREREKKSAMSEEEKSRRLAEMTSNAAWREKQRTKNVDHYRAMDEKEEEEGKKRSHDPDFIRQQLRTAAADGTMEKRVQANRHNIQKGHGHMERNFARR